MRDNACTVAGFRDAEDLVTLQVSWTPPFYACYCSMVTIGTDISGGGGGYVYKWYTSTDGFNWGVPAGTGSSFSLTVPGGCPNPSTDHLFVRLVVESADGQIETKFTRIDGVDQIPGDSSPCQQFNEGSGSRSAENEESPVLGTIIFPNPTAGKITIDISRFAGQLLDVRLFDSVGKEVLYKNQQVEEGSARMEMDLSKLPPGIYAIWVNELEVKKIVKQ